MKDIFILAARIVFIGTTCIASAVFAQAPVDSQSFLLSEGSVVTFSAEKIKAFTNKDVDPGIVTAVKAAPKAWAINVDEKGQYIDQQVTKVSYLTIGARGRLLIRKLDVPWVAIVADQIFIENAATLEDKAVITRSPDNQFLIDGVPGSLNLGQAPNPSEDTGNPGNHGANGEPGGHGKRVQLPDVFVFFNKINVANASPAGGVHVRFVLDGVRGGNGGNGGTGQAGSPGARGTKSECNNLPSWLGGGCTECRAGPGAGGKGGNGGVGGQGGNAALGGDGANVIFVGPQPALDTTGFFLVSQRSGQNGSPGAAGSRGSSGSGGGGGYQCKCCTAGGGTGEGGDPASPPTFGPGASIPPQAKGNDGATMRIFRNNADLF